MAEPLKNQYGPDVPRRIGAMIAAVLRRHLPQDYPGAAAVLLDSIGPRLDGTAPSGMGGFLHLPHVLFVGEHGLGHFEVSMRAQHALTQRFTAQFSLRPYLVHHRDANARLRSGPASHAADDAYGRQMARTGNAVQDESYAEATPPPAPGVARSYGVPATVDRAALRYTRPMVDARRTWIGLIAVAAIVALLAAGWWMMRSREGRPPFSLPVPEAAPRATGSGTAKLSWGRVDPTAYGEDGATDPVAGFRVYVGPSPDALRFEASIDDPAATSYVVKRLPKGTLYYTVTTYTKLGIESPQPAPVSKTIE